MLALRAAMPSFYRRGRQPLARLLCSTPTEKPSTSATEKPDISEPASSSSSKTTPEDVAGTSHTASSSSTASSTDAEQLNTLLNAALSHVPTHGWTEAAISRAISDLSLSPASRGLLTRGPVEVVEHFVSKSNRKLAQNLAIENEKQAAAGGGDHHVGRATFAIRQRIEMITPYAHNWTHAIALQALPQNSPRALKASALLIDEIAHYARYRSPDFSWYTDRTVLAFIYHMTELYWLTDRSPDRVETWRFLERRLRNSQNTRNLITDTYSTVMNLSDAVTGSIFTILRSAPKSY